MTNVTNITPTPDKADKPSLPPRAQRGAHLEWVPLAKISVNERAQREFREPWAESILAHFDIDKLQFPTVNLREGRFYVIDGQHSIWAYKMWLGCWDDQKVQCLVHRGLTEEQEAELFLSLNNKKTIPVFEKFRVAVTAGRGNEADIDRIVRANGCKVSQNRSQPGAIGAVTALQAVYRDQGGEILGAVVRTIRDAYGDAGYDASVLRGIGLVIGRYPMLDRPRLTVALHDAAGGVKGLLNKAYVSQQRTGGSKAESVAQAVVDTYNRSRGPKLIPWLAAA